MMSIRNVLLCAATLVLGTQATAQTKTISLKKGEALDLLLLTTNPAAKEEQDEYFAQAVPIAQKWGYQPQYSTRISHPPTQGNYWPSLFIIAKWTDYDKRIQFTEDIVQQYPKFHERRRLIWPNFHLTYWKVEEDKEVIIDPEKFYVATSYWSGDSKAFEVFERHWSETVTTLRGQIVLKCKDGTSPFGYHYDPEVFTITEWSSQEAYERFHEKNLAMDQVGVKHVNQFILQ